jgi:hypothetical protein
MDLKSLLVDTKTTWVEFPGLDGFEVELANLSRKELVALRKRCTQNKFNRKTRQFEESLDEDKFIKEFTTVTVKGWKGLKLEYLEDLLLVDLAKQDTKLPLTYTDENAQVLVENSSEFDNWLNEVVFDLDNFRSQGEEETKEKPKKIS